MQITSCGLKEEEQIGACTNKNSRGDDDHRKIDEDKGCLNNSQDDHDEREDSIDYLEKPKHLRAGLADILFIGPALKHELFSAVLIVLEEPSHSYHHLP